MRTAIVLGFLSFFTCVFANGVDKSKLPEPVFESQPAYVELYYKAWDLAWKHVKEQEGIPQSPYMDEAFWDDTIWLWDTEFMSLFCKYAPDVFPGVESLNNFYKPMLDGQSSVLKIQHPDNPAFFFWIEYENYKFSNDQKYIKNLMSQTQYLKRFYHLFDSMKPGMKFNFKHVGIRLEKKDKGYRWGGVQNGMDNTPRGRGQYHKILWVDALAQQALAAKHIVKLSDLAGDRKTAKEFQKHYEDNKALLNKYYWDKEDGFYYDIYESDLSFSKVMTPASYWAMLAEVPDEKQALRMLEYAIDSTFFGGKYPWPSVSRSDKDFNSRYGDYWRGAIWAPTAYMATKALEKYGFFEVANKHAENLVKLWSDTYKNYKPATIWECYSPSLPEPSHRVYGKKLEEVRPDFCGWSALVPISLFIENVLGFYDVNAQTRTVKWNLHQKETHGIKNLRFGDVVTDIIYKKDGAINVKSNKPYKLVVNKKEFKIKAGNNISILK